MELVPGFRPKGKKTRELRLCQAAPGTMNFDVTKRVRAIKPSSIYLKYWNELTCCNLELIAVEITPLSDGKMAPVDISD